MTQEEKTWLAKYIREKAASLTHAAFMLECGSDSELGYILEKVNQLKQTIEHQIIMENGDTEQ